MFDGRAERQLHITIMSVECRYYYFMHADFRLGELMVRTAGIATISRRHVRDVKRARPEKSSHLDKVLFHKCIISAYISPLIIIIIIIIINSASGIVDANFVSGT